MPPPGSRPPSKSLVAAVAAIIFVDAIGLGLLLPMLAYLAEHLGGRPAVVAQLVAVYSLATFAMTPVLGALSDRLGRRRLLLVTLSGSAASYLGMLLSPALAPLFAFRALGGACAGNASIAQALVTDETDSARHLGLIATLDNARSLGAVTGPLIGGLAALLFDDPAAYYRASLALAFAASLGSFAIAALVFRSAPRPNAPSRPQGARVAPEPLAGALPLLVVSGLVAFAMGVMFSITALYAERVLAWRSPQMGGLIAAVMIFSVLGRVAVTRLPGASRGLGWRLAAVVGVSALLMLAVPVFRSSGTFAVSYVAFTTTNIVSQMMVTTLVSLRAPLADRGFWLGVNQSATSIATVGSAIVSGLAFEFVAPQAPFVIGAAALAVAFVVALGVVVLGGARRPDAPSLAAPEQTA